MEMAKMATIVKQHIIKNNLYVSIVGKNYVLVEGWQFAGGLMGLFPRIVKVENIGTMKWLAQAEIVNFKTDKVVATGFAICSKEENKKASFDEYAILSMAQTRAIGKVYRNLIGWVIKMAGYESTPAEEMGSKAGINSQNAPEASRDVKNGIKVEELRGMLKGTTDAEKLADLKKRTGIVLASFEISEKHTSVIIAGILNQEVKK